MDGEHAISVLCIATQLQSCIFTPFFITWHSMNDSRLYGIALAVTAIDIFRFY